MSWVFYNLAEQIRANTQSQKLKLAEAIAINFDKLQIIMHLIDSGAEIDARSISGKTALMYATGNSRREIAELLVSSGASMTITDNRDDRAGDLIDKSISRQPIQLPEISTRPQLNLLKEKYRQFIPEGDRLLKPILSRNNN